MTGWVARFAIRQDFDQPEILLVTEDPAGASGWMELGDGYFSIHSAFHGLPAEDRVRV
jgi:hypothetical protein